jgi:hypothetical protein
MQDHLSSSAARRERILSNLSGDWHGPSPVGANQKLRAGDPLSNAIEGEFSSRLHCRVNENRVSIGFSCCRSGLAGLTAVRASRSVAILAGMERGHFPAVRPPSRMSIQKNKKNRQVMPTFRWQLRLED